MEGFPEISPFPSQAPIPTPYFTQTLATFAIFTEGRFRNLSSTNFFDRSQDAFISASRPSVVQVKNPSTTWGGFFNSLPMRVTPTCLREGAQEYCTNPLRSLKFFLNGKRTDNLLTRKIVHGDRVLISYGEETQEQITLQLAQIPPLPVSSATPSATLTPQP